MSATTVPGAVWRLLIIGLVFHWVYIGTVFDCYFTSPVVHGMQGYTAGPAEAKRLVLIVGDGLRADLLFGKHAFSMIPGAPEVVAPYLRSIIEERGAWGISHTRIPTESRPGHVALICGMYEDVSAVTEGWQENPLDVDSVFNQSSSTFSFGAPDILPMFSQGATPGKVETWSYAAQDIDYTKDATAMDIWVLEQLRTLFHNATTDPRLDSRLRSDKTVFFLHLIGLDTTGHSYRPHSKEYLANIQVVDRIVEETERLFDAFYNDKETAFVFTADHGMSKTGNHGDGDPDNTRTPIIAWDKGIRGPLPDTSPSSHDEYSNAWGLTHLFRRDVRQADVAALMSTLIGTQWPVNSVGVLPDVDPTIPGYLLPHGGNTTLARAALVNAKVILEHYRVKHEQRKERTLFYRAYPYFSYEESGEKIPAASHLSRIQSLIFDGAYAEARIQAADLIEHALEGLQYLQTYDCALIRGIVVAAYLGWMACSALTLLSAVEDKPPLQQNCWATHISAALVLAVSWTVFTIERSPRSFYIYIVFPCYFWHQVILHSGMLVDRKFMGAPMSRKTVRTLAWRSALVLGSLFGMVRGYTDRRLWSSGFIIGAWWSWNRVFGVHEGHRSLPPAYCLTLICTAIFPYLRVDKEENMFYILAGGATMIATGAVGYIYIHFDDPKEQRWFRTVVEFQIYTILASMGCVWSIVRSLRAKAGLPPGDQTAAWVILIFGTIFPFFARVPRHNTLARLLILFLGFGVCFVWLSISVEGLFYVAFCVSLLVWVEAETVMLHALPPGPASAREYKFFSDNTRDTAKCEPTGLGRYRYRADDLRIAVFFLFFVQLAFFGAGNFPSISSFYLEPVYRLVAVCNPFLVAKLLMLKILAPYVIVARAFTVLNRRLHLPPFNLLLVALALADVMTITFFLNVTDTGSWNEIGHSISSFCVHSVLLVWSTGLCVLDEVLMHDRLGAPVTIGRGDEDRKAQ